MTNYLARTTDIMDDATRLERQMDWMLFGMDQDRRYYSDPDGWVPGEPLFDYPSFLADGQYVRPMFELLGHGLFHLPRETRVAFYDPMYTCHDCEVTWSGEPICWVCGNEQASMWGLSNWSFLGYASQDVRLTFEANLQFEDNLFRELWESLNRSFNSAMMLNLGHNVSLGIQEGVAVVRGPRLRWGAVDEIESLTTILPIPLSTIDVGGITIPSDIDLSGNVEIPVPRFETPLPQAMFDRMYVLDNIPITERRRPR